MTPTNTPAPRGGTKEGLAIAPDWVSDCGTCRLVTGDCRIVLPTLEADSFTACVCDPPYELGFMGKRWDGTGVAFDPATWREVWRVLKPGAYLLAFGGTRTYHRMVCAIEDAGFEIRDCIMWIYGSGFPKSLDVSKALDKAAGEQRERIRGVRSGVVASTYAQDAWSKEFKDSVLSSDPITPLAHKWSGWGTALKPACEPIVLARKPLIGTVVANVQEHGTGALNIDGCRIACSDKAKFPAGVVSETEGVYGGGNGRYADRSRTEDNSPLGRWPANIIHDGSEEVLAGFPQTASGLRLPHHNDNGKESGTFGAYKGAQRNQSYGGDSGSAARFFYCAKASRSERGEGNKHPTVKPLALMEYLVRLVSVPEGNRILDPFAGSGTTLLACYNAFHEAVGIDLEADHVDIGSGRVTGEVEKTPLFPAPPPTQRSFLEER
jgi:DNA modification methylase